MKRKMEAEKAKASGNGGESSSQKPSKNGGDAKDKKRPSNGGSDEPKKKKVKTEEKSAEKPKKVESKSEKPSSESKTPSKSSTPKPKESSSKSEKKEKPKKEAKDDKKSLSNRVEVEETIIGLPRMEKHNIVSAVLRRWKYCLDSWPGELPKEPPAGYIEAHVPGLYVGSSNLVMGQLKDLRPFEERKTPSMTSLLSIKTVDLRDILIKGITEQMKHLGTGPEDEKLKAKLKHELEKAEKLKVKKIERKFREAMTAIGKPIPGKDLQDNSKEDDDDE